MFIWLMNLVLNLKKKKKKLYVPELFSLFQETYAIPPEITCGDLAAFSVFSSIYLLPNRALRQNYP